MSVFLYFVVYRGSVINFNIFKKINNLKIEPVTLGRVAPS